jgi:tetratricopeptide (TPR) repeat protein
LPLLGRKDLSDSTQNQLREALAETARAHLAPAKPKKLAAVRVTRGGYFAAAALLTFVALVCLRTQRDLAALIVVAGTWTVIPLLVLTDRLSFDGDRLSRTGLSSFIARRWRGRAPGISLEDIERVEVTTLRTLRRGGNVRYRYRVELTGRGLSTAFASGGEHFRQMVQKLLPRIPDHKLDTRACELRDHLAAVKLVRAEAARLGIAPASVLEETSETTRKRVDKHRQALSNAETPQDEAERGRLLRKSANELRVAGCLRQSAEAFRRALLISPTNASLIYEYARLLKSQASARGEARMLARACAALRLAAMRAPTDSLLLQRVGESFLEYGEPRRAAKAFRRALEVDEQGYRAQLGLAEVALSQGKLAHVIHHYNEATRIAPDKAAARMARSEADYYSRLNDDEDYLAAELRRMNWLEGAGRVQRLTARLSFAALLIALLGSSVDQVVAGMGWAFASSAIIAWSGSLIIRRLLADRGRAETGEA